jgi:hypothetical protein
MIEFLPDVWSQWSSYDYATRRQASELLDRPVFVPETLLAQEVALSQFIEAESQANPAQSRALAGIFSRDLRRNHLLLIPFRPVRIGGESRARMPVSLGFDLSDGLKANESGFTLDLDQLPFPTPDRVPIIVFFSPNYSSREEEAVQAIFGVSQADLARRLEERPVFYEMHPWRPGFPEVMLIGARDPATLFRHLENDSSFRAAVERFYNQEYRPDLPKLY